MSLKKERSVPETDNRFTVNASPFNPVKFELGVIVVLGVSLLAGSGQLFSTYEMEVAVLGLFGLVSMMWIIVRIKGIQRTLQDQKNAEPTDHG